MKIKAIVIALPLMLSLLACGQNEQTEETQAIEQSAPVASTPIIPSEEASDVTNQETEQKPDGVIDGEIDTPEEKAILLDEAMPAEGSAVETMEGDVAPVDDSDVNDEDSMIDDSAAEDETDDEAVPQEAINENDGTIAQ